MILDLALVFSAKQDITASAAVVSTSYVDQLAAGSALPQGLIAQVMFLITTTCLAGGGASNVTFAVYHDSDPAFGTETLLVQSAAIAKATLVAGFVVILPIPAGAKRYLRTKAIVDTNNLTAGNLSAQIVLAADVTLDKTL